ncbi:MAG: hypothetical protein Q9225_005445 [Loekoesia sp. 1 TL-2023]
MLSSQTPYQWQKDFGGATDGFQAASVDQQTFTQSLSTNKIDIDVPPDDNFCPEPYYGSTFFDSGEYKVRAKRMAADSKFGSPGHSRVQGLQRMRRHSSSQHLRSINPCTTIPPTDKHKMPHESETLPATIPVGCFPGTGNLPEGGNVWWPANTTFQMKSKAPQEEGFIEDLLDGAALLRSPYHNKGSAFPPEEREAFKLYGLLPPNVQTLKEQVERAYQQYSSRTGALAKNTFMTSMKDQNELIQDHLKEMFSIIYTPTEGDAIQNFSRLFRKPEGCFLNIFDRDRVYDNLAQWGTADDIDYIVVTDGEEVR